MKKLENGTNPLEVMEMFAGVGGLRLGLEAVRDDTTASCFKVVWSNQYEPDCRLQHAAQVYQKCWGDAGFVNRDLFDVLGDASEMARIDTLNPDMLVGGFPCQDYSVARPSNQAVGLQGKKGVLWWALYRVLQARRDAGSPIKYLLLENVDRLINSPTACRGRDFAIILASLQSLGYSVEWRVVNSADFGFPQRRKRVFIVAYHESSAAYWDVQEHVHTTGGKSWLTDAGTLAQALPASLKPGTSLRNFTLPSDILAVQTDYVAEKAQSKFKSAGVCIDGTVYTGDVVAAPLTDFTRYVGQSEAMTLSNIVAATGPVPAKFFIDDKDLSRWQYLKGAKSIERVAASGHKYSFSEGAMAFPDALDRPSRTIITSEGGRSASRTTHVVRHTDGRLRRLTPEELEALTGFPRGFTDGCGLTDAKRAFLMGNALVTGLVQAIGTAIFERHAGSGVTELAERALDTQSFQIKG